ncbi:unnamed protein product [Alopecurus aequalis]
MVLDLLPAYADRARFAAVCPQWRAAARLPLTPPQPLLALPDGTFYSLPSGKKYSFPGCGFAGYKSTCGSWLVFPRDDGCFLVDPFSRSTVTLPALSRVRLRPPNAVAKWSYEHREKVPDPYVTWMHISESDKLHLSKGKLYAITKDENLLLVNISQDHSTGDPQVSRIVQVIKGDPCPCFSGVFNHENMHHQKHYLVESRGVLLMVCRSIWCRVPEPGENDEIVASGNQFECSRFASVPPNGIPGDIIFFLDDDEESCMEYGYDEENTSFSCYDMRSRSVSSALSKISWKRGDEMRLAAWLFPQDQ